MKTKYIISNNWFCTFFLLLFILLGCTEEDNFPLNEGNQRLFATIIEETTDTRVILNDDTINQKVEVYWTTGDAIGVFGTESGSNIHYKTNESAISEDGKTAVFETTSTVAEGDLTVYYPYQEDATIAPNGTLNLTMPASQSYVTDESGSAQPDPAVSVMAGKGKDGKITFRNLFSILRANISGSDGEVVKQVLFTDLSGRPVSGKFSTRVPEIEFPETGSDKDLQIELDCKEGVPLFYDTLTQFYLIVPARNYDKGFQIDFVLSDDETITKTIGASGGITLRRNRLYPIGDMTPKEKETTADLGYKGFKSDAELFLEFVYAKESLILNALNYTSNEFTKGPFEGEISREKFELFFLELEAMNEMAEQYEQAIERLEESGVLQRPTQTRGLFTSTKDFLVWVSGSGKRNRERIHTVASNLNAAERTKLYNGLRKQWKEKSSSEADFWSKLENGDYDSSAGQMYNDFYHNADTDFPFLAQDKGLTPHKIVVNEGAKGIEAGGNLALDAASAVAPGFGKGMTLVKVSDNVEKMAKSESWKEAAEHGFNAAGDILEEITGDIGYTGFNGGDVVNFIRNKAHSSIFKQEDTNETKGKVTIEDGNRDKATSSIVIVQKGGGGQNNDGSPSIYITLNEMISDGIEMLIEAGNWVMTIVNEKGYRETVEVTVERGKDVVVNVDTEAGKIEEYDKSEIITLITSKSAGETISFSVNAEIVDRKDVWIDFNNNGKKDDGEEVTKFHHPYTLIYEPYILQSRTLSIYGSVISLNVAPHSKVTSLEASGHNTLEHLDFGGERELTQLNVSNCTALEILSFSKTGITSLDLSGCTALKGLWCHDNQLTTLNISESVKLKQFYCSDNQLTSLDVSGFAELVEFYCQKNQLTTLNVTGCTALTSLYCTNNQLTSLLGLSSCTSLTRLDCSDNNLSGVRPDYFDNYIYRGYDIRYIYRYDKIKEKYVMAVDTGKGFWYPHEPEGGCHSPEPCN